jgi:protein subunit release factor A
LAFPTTKNGSNRLEDKMPCKRTLLFSARRKDFRVDTFRAGGKGGQHQNKTDSAVRITHIESGLSAESRSERSQHRNRKIAFHRLAKKLVNHYVLKEKRERYGSTKVIRTYHEPDDRVVDHESGLRYSYRHTVGRGRLEKVIEDRHAWKLMNLEK